MEVLPLAEEVPPLMKEVLPLVEVLPPVEEVLPLVEEVPPLEKVPPLVSVPTEARGLLSAVLLQQRKRVAFGPDHDSRWRFSSQSDRLIPAVKGV